MLISATVLVVCLLGNGNSEQIPQSGGGRQTNVSTQTNPQQNGIVERPSASTEFQLESAIGNTPRGAKLYEPVLSGEHYGQSTTQTVSQTDFQDVTGQSVSQTQSEDIRNNSHYENFGHNVIRPSHYRQWTNTLTPQGPQGNSGANGASYSAGGKPLSSFGVEDYPSSRIGLYPHVRRQPDSVGLEYRDGTTDTNGKQESTVRINPGNNGEKDNERLPWQVSVFSKELSSFSRICGGSMVSRSAVISAASCYWDPGDTIDAATRASQIAVGAGEVVPYRSGEYNSYRQQSDVDAIKIPPSYGDYTPGSRANIAVLLLGRPFDERGIRPVCISFDRELEEQQLIAGKIAMTLGASNKPLEKRVDLQVLRVPYLPVEECQAAMIRPVHLLVKEKICTGELRSKPIYSYRRELFHSPLPLAGNLCSQDLGAGLVFYYQDYVKGIAVPFLRGVASISPPCDKVIPTLYTRVSAYRSFLEEHLGDVEKECKKYYPQLGASMGKETRDTEFVCNCFC